MDQVFSSYGLDALALIAEGQQTTRRDIPLGAKFIDGPKTYRWAFHTMASGVGPGKLLIRPLSGDNFHLSSDQMLSTAKAGNNRGNTIGDNMFYVRSATQLSNTAKYVDGQAIVISGSGKGHAYTINSYEPGSTTKLTWVQVRGQIARAMSSDTQMIFLANKFYGCSLSPVLSTLVEGYAPAGATTCSTLATSGHQLLQTGGPGVGVISGSVGAAGLFLSPGSAGRLMSATAATSTTTQGVTQNVVARSLHEATALKYGCVEWLIE